MGMRLCRELKSERKAATLDATVDTKGGTIVRVARVDDD